MTKIIQLTDLHMVPEGQTIIGLDPFTRIGRAVEHINRYQADADLVIISGDLTHYGDEASYRRLRHLLADLLPPMVVTIGNHDRREIFRSVFADVMPDDDGFIQRVVDFEDCRVIVLDTAHERLADDPLHAAGTLCDLRLGFLERALAAADARPVLVFMHHPPHDTGFVGMDEIKLTNGEAFHDLIGRFGNVRHIFAGHVHRTISGSYRGTPYSIFKSPVHQQPMPFEVSDSDSSVDEPGAYGIIRVLPNGIQVHNEDYEIAVRTDEAGFAARAVA
ncbi:phosphodiesterase [Ciceribacter sp. L1K22]|uniref:2', 3'cyclic nucleotide phosphodiesterase SpdA n=1 Tax=Ciceribacter sp. L1K22 TaxID=2820275 RepID=UPI001ABE86B1|nr:phosphodiesterase [Ciceribacter sp. L1K22]MBO3758851.1 phosphodiesterase [Ciceribacter sp. L1K22]